MSQPPRDNFDDRLDDALRRVYRPPDPTRTRETVRVTSATPVAARGRRAFAWRLAAGIALALAAAWIVSYAMLSQPESSDSGYALRTMNEAYRQTVADGFEPDWVCETDQEFADTFRDKLRQPLILAGAPAAVEPIGLSYGNTLSRRTVHVLARVKGEPVIVFVDLADTAIEPPPPTDPGLYLHRRDAGGLVMYELSPWPSPSVLDHLNPPPPPPPLPSSSHRTPCNGGR